MQVIKMVLEGARPSVEISYDVPAHYVELMTACWDEEPQTRPHFKQVDSSSTRPTVTLTSSSIINQLNAYCNCRLPDHDV